MGANPNGREWEILRYSARIEADPGAIERIERLLGEPLKEDRLIELARRHGMLSLLFRNLRRYCPDALPSSLRSRLEGEHEENARRNLLLSTELIKLLRALAAGGIPALPYKGPVLAKQVYGDESLRRADDLDLIVRQEDAWRAGAILCDQGFRPEVPLSRSQWPWYLRSECDRVYVHTVSGMYVEVHWRAVPPYFSLPIDLEPFWGRARQVDLAGNPVPGLAPEDLILLLSIHGAKHVWERLEWVCCLSCLIRRYGVDWDRLLDRARDAGALRMLLLGLSLARDLAAAELPDGIYAEIRGCPALAWLHASVLEQMVLLHPPRGRRQLLFRLRAREHLADRIRYCLLRLITPTYKDLRMVSLPESISFLYYFVRPLRGVLGVTGLWRGIPAERKTA